MSELNNIHKIHNYICNCVTLKRKNMQKLKVGDNVCHIYHGHWRDKNAIPSYTFQVVARVTPTLAILDNGERVKNTPTSQENKDEGYSYFFDRIGENGKRYFPVTPKILEDARIDRERERAKDWFWKKNNPHQTGDKNVVGFTHDEVVKIYELLNPKIYE